MTAKPAFPKAATKSAPATRGLHSCRDRDAPNADELKTLLGCTFDFETEFNRLSNASRDFVEGSCGTDAT
jgi:hypothetical protein